jgi:hypothetical protein
MNIEKKLATMVEKIESPKMLQIAGCNMVEINFHKYYKQQNCLNKIGD